MYELAGEDVAVLIRYMANGDYVVPDVGSVTYTVRDNAGQPITDLIDQPITVDETTTQSVITIPAIKNAITADIENRFVDVKFSSGEAPYRVRVVYKLTQFLNFTASPADVRSWMGCNSNELEDADIDMVAAYFKAGDLLSTDDAPNLFTDALATGGLDGLNANQAIVYVATLQAIPSLQLRIAQSETNGVLKYSRIAKLDFNKLQKDTADRLAALAEDVAGAAFVTPDLLILSVRTDPITNA